MQAAACYEVLPIRNTNPDQSGAFPESYRFRKSAFFSFFIGDGGWQLFDAHRESSAANSKKRQTQQHRDTVAAGCMLRASRKPEAGRGMCCVSLGL